MKVDDVVRQALWFFPTLYDNRTAVLANAMLRYGNGYEWRSGELVDAYGPYDDEERRHPHSSDPATVLEQMIERWNEDRSGRDSPLTDTALQTMRANAEATAARVGRVRGNIDELVHRRAALECVEDLCEFSPLENLPADITDEWLDAAEEVCHAVLACRRSHHLTDRDLGRGEAPRPVSRATREMVHRIWQEAMGEPASDLPSDQELAAKAAREREQRVEQDRRAVDQAHRQARAVLVKIARIRAGRA